MYEPFASVHFQSLIGAENSCHVGSQPSESVLTVDPPPFFTTMVTLALSLRSSLTQKSNAGLEFCLTVTALGA